MSETIEQVIGFQLSGKFAHFRKFFTNSSSLSYKIPPRTAICGMLASVLTLPRDSYYELFSPDNIRISIAIAHNHKIKKVTQSINYLHLDYYKQLTGKKGGAKHSQCKFELLTGRDNIKYDIYLAILKKRPEFDRLANCLQQRNFGYGIYLGQRQFLGSIDKVRQFDSATYFPSADLLDSACPDSAIQQLNYGHSAMVMNKEKMPSHLRAVKDGREIAGIQLIIFEAEGRRIAGSFRDIYQVNEKYLYFM